ncbi:TipJ family phage tail tip protein, partial [Puniceibacterium confluentis]|uniref:TipJ family phage tail tip protein n=1 Tax=Puniceibacterium confluentis TaxID=1958944 RepID=UPI004035F675
MTRVITAPLFDPGLARTDRILSEGLSLAEIITASLPGLSDHDRLHLRVTLVTDRGVMVIDMAHWSRVRPKPGVRVVLRLVPGNNGFRSVLLAVVSIAALALAPMLAPAIGLGTGTLATSVVALGLNLVGFALVNALVPIEVPDQDRAKNRYTLSGWNNTARPDDPVPWPVGRHRYAPPYAALPYTVISGDDQYIVALFCFGYGRLDISDVKIGDTSIDAFSDVQIELREGVEADDPVTLYPRQVLEERAGVELLRPLPRDDAGELTGGAAEEVPIVRETALNTQIVSLIFFFPAGLVRYTREGDARTLGVSLRIRQRLSDADDWAEVETLDFLARKEEPFFRQYSWQPPSRGRWQVEVTRMTDERTNSRYQDRVILTAIQSVRPEYPLNIDKPMALLAMRIRASYQLNGQLDSVNAIVRRHVQDWDGEVWAEALSRNPAAAFVAMLQGPQNPFPVQDSEIDWELMQDWHAFCTLKGLKYDRIHEDAQGLGDALRQIAMAGRATPRHDGLKWGVVIDRPQDLVVDHLSARNSSGLTWSRQYLDPPDGIRVKFNDASNDYEEATRIIPWPGNDGPITLTEEMTLPGKTDPDEIWIETRRRMYEILHRPDTFTALQDGAARVVTRGDLMIAAHDVLDSTQMAARVTAVEGTLVELDEAVTMSGGESYGLRFRVFADSEDSIGSSVVASVATVTGTSRLLRLSGTTAR